MQLHCTFFSFAAKKTVYPICGALSQPASIRKYDLCGVGKGLIIPVHSRGRIAHAEPVPAEGPLFDFVGGLLDGHRLQVGAIIEDKFPHSLHSS